MATQGRTHKDRQHLALIAGRHGDAEAARVGKCSTRSIRRYRKEFNVDPASATTAIGRSADTLDDIDAATTDPSPLDRAHRSQQAMDLSSDWVDDLVDIASDMAYESTAQAETATDTDADVYDSDLYGEYYLTECENVAKEIVEKVTLEELAAFANKSYFASGDRYNARNHPDDYRIADRIIRAAAADRLEKCGIVLT